MLTPQIVGYIIKTEAVMNKSILVYISLVILLTGYILADVIHVPGDYPTIQAGIDAANAGDVVLVAPGTYYEHDIDFLGKPITVMGTDPLDSAIVALTIVDGLSQGSVFTFHTGESLISLLAGLTITGGRAVSGGGIYCETSSPTIWRCVIEGNESYGSDPNGGCGIYCSELATPYVLE